MKFEEGILASDYPELVGKRMTKQCPDGHNYVIRVNRETGELFLGCEKYPTCRNSDEISGSLLMRLTGAPTLPGFG